MISSYRFYQVRVGKKFWSYCYTSKKNALGKYTVFTIAPNGSRRDLRDLNKKKDAIKWAKKRMLNHLQSLGRHDEIALWEPPEKLTQVEVF